MSPRCASPNPKMRTPEHNPSSSGCKAGPYQTMSSPGKKLGKPASPPGASWTNPLLTTAALNVSCGAAGLILLASPPCQLLPPVPFALRRPMLVPNMLFFQPIPRLYAILDSRLHFGEQACR